MLPLVCKSHYSFLEGASQPEELVETCAALGLDGLALTDTNGVYGIVKAHCKAQQLGLPLIVGSELSLEDGSGLVLLAQNKVGYARLCQLVSAGCLRSQKGSCRVLWDEVLTQNQGLLALWGGPRSRLAQPAPCEDLAGSLREAFGDRIYAWLSRNRQPEELGMEVRLRARAARHGLPLVASQEVLYHCPSRRPLQDVLRCIRHGVRLSEAGCLLAANTEHALKGPEQLAALYADLPEALVRTREIAARCDFSLAELQYRYPSEKLPDGSSSIEWLSHLTYKGALKRYDGVLPDDVRVQLERELQLIDKLDYCGYFLTMWEIVRFCRGQGIICQGRGSAANSAVCYCLGITSIDPVRMNLLFERFISQERAEPPDIDLDIEHNRREEVIQHVYTKYGRSHAAMVATCIRYRARSAARDVGKVLGLPVVSLERLACNLGAYDGLDEAAFVRAGLDPKTRPHAQLLKLGNQIQGFPRHLSIHPGGFLLGHDPICQLVPIENGAMADRTVIQWDKYDVEALGLFKVDLLGLGALHQLHIGFDLIRQHRGRSFTMATIPAEDPATWAMIQKADTVGVFQIESRGQMAMIPRLKPRCFYDLVVEISIVRPGPITGNMVHPYLRRRNGQEPVDFPHPSLEPVLGKTLGVPLFQEQVMKIAMVAADYTPGEADQLRRDMAAWRKRGLIEQHRERLIPRMIAKGITPEFAERVFQQIQGFAEYGFPESHAASFALIAYATAWLKCHYPLEFTCALLNALPMGFYSAATIVEDFKRHRHTALPIDVGFSHWECTLEPLGHDFALRMGLRFVKGLGQAAVERVIAARQQQAFRSVQDLADRTRLDKGSLLVLAEAGALGSLQRRRRSALWQVRGRRPAEERPGLPFEWSEPIPVLPALERFESISWDYRSSSHSVQGHLLEPLRPQLQALGLPDAQAVAKLADGRRVLYAGLVICRQRPSTAKGVTFMTLEDETGFVNLVLWKAVFERFSTLARTTPFLGVTGRLQRAEGVVHVIVDKLWKPQLELPRTRVKSRDFQ